MPSLFLRRVSKSVYRTLKRLGIAPKPRDWPRSGPSIRRGGRWQEMRQALAEEVGLGKPLRSGNPSFHRTLLERIEVLAQGVHNPLVASLFNGDAIDIEGLPLEIEVPTESVALNKAQQIAYRGALQKSTFMIWGAPSTGKTTVLSAIVRQFASAGETTLLCSHTRKALDHAESALSVPGLTAKTTTAAVLDDEIANHSFDNVVIEEASMVELPTVLFLSSLADKRVLLVGDPMQLGPVVRSDTELADRWMKSDIFQHMAGVSDIAGLYVWQERNHERCVFLKDQYRLPKPIGVLANQLYYSDRLTSVLPSEGRVTFIDTSLLNPHMTKSQGSPVNEVHADIVAEEVAWALEHGARSWRSDDIGVITPFRAQQQHIKQRLGQRKMPHDIEVGTAHTFQGNDKLCLILDLTVSEGSYQFKNLGGSPISELNAARMLNTAMSRCRADRDDVRCQFVVIANRTHIRNVYPNSNVSRFLERVRARATKLIEPRERPSPSHLGAYSRHRISRFEQTTEVLLEELRSDHESVGVGLTNPTVADEGPVRALVEKYCEVISRLMQSLKGKRASDGAAVFEWSEGMDPLLDGLLVTAINLIDLSDEKRYATDRRAHFQVLVNALYQLIYEASMRPSIKDKSRRPPPVPVFDPEAFRGESYGRVRVWVREFRNFYDHDTTKWDTTRKSLNAEMRERFFKHAIGKSEAVSALDYLICTIFLFDDVVRYLVEIEKRLHR